MIHDLYGTGPSIHVSPAQVGAPTDPNWSDFSLDTWYTNVLDEQAPTTVTKATKGALNATTHPGGPITKYEVARFANTDGDEEDPSNPGKYFAYKAKSYVVTMGIGSGATDQRSQVGIGDCETDATYQASTMDVIVWLMDTRWDPDVVTWNAQPSFKGVKVTITKSASLSEGEGFRLSGSDSPVLRIVAPLGTDGAPIPIYGVGLQIDSVVPDDISCTASFTLTAREDDDDGAFV